MNVLLLILQGINLVSSEIVPVEQLIEKLKSIFTLNPNVTVSIQNLASDAIQADADTLTMVAAWQQKNGLPVTVQPPASTSAASPGATSTSAPSPVAPAAPAPADPTKTSQ